MAVRGRVIRLTPAEVVVETGGGRQSTWPRSKVARIDLSRPAALKLADDLFANRRYAAAADAYQRAADTLENGLVRDQARERLILALSAIGAEARVAAAFVDIISSNPGSYVAVALPLFGRPLADAAGVGATLDPRERTLATDAALPLLRALQFWARLEQGRTDRARAAADDLAVSKEPRIRSLAVVCRGWLTYRADGAAAAAKAIEARQARLDPFARPHATVLLARCYADLGRHADRARIMTALAFAYEDVPLIAAEALYDAGLAFTAADKPERAAIMFGLLVADHPASPRAGDARRRIDQLKKH